jgi:hypothetical protein
MAEEKEFQGMPWYPALIRPDFHVCNACGRPNTIYNRKLSSAMANSLIRLHVLHEQDPQLPYFHVRQFDRNASRGDFAKVKFWGLATESLNMEPAKKSSGLWRITDFGRAFVLKRVQVPSNVLVKWGSEHLGFAGELIDIQGCLGNKFNYAELMGHVTKGATA